ncbi:MAG: PAS domain-containing sensor histidine kinase, partial [Dehalococcoidia bacterium]|nr:PAS domain-containing sensor histidine kinase [Dehalococcoidia bacterium]
AEAHFEARIRHRDGDYRWFFVTRRTVSSPDGALARSTLHLTDITPLKAASTALRESEFRFRLVAESVQDILFRVALRPFRFDYVSPAVTRVTGYPPSAFYRDTDLVWRILHPDDALRLRDLVAEPPPRPVIARLYAADGALVWLELVPTVHYDAHGAPLAVEGVARDVTERKRDETEALLAQSTAEFLYRAKSEFLSRMSHELRTPMNAILGFSQLLQPELESPKHREWARYIERGARRIMALMDDLLDLSRVESGLTRFRLAEVAARPIVEDVLALTRDDAEKTQVKVSVDVPDDLFLWADAKWLRHVLFNLVTNALRYNRVGGAAQVTAQRVDDDWTRLTVTDTGPGIPPDKHARLFTPFDRLGMERSDIDGTGLGLALCKRLV